MNRMNRLLIAALPLVLAPTAPALGQETTGIVREVGPVYHLVVNTKPVPGVEPRVIQGRAFVPLRPIAELTGLSLEWLPRERTVRAYRGDERMTLRIGSTQAYINGQGRALGAAPVVRNGQTWVALRTLERLLPGAQVTYNAVTDVAFVNTDGTVRDPNVVQPGFPERPGPNSLTEGFVDPLDRNKKK